MGAITPPCGAPLSGCENSSASRTPGVQPLAERLSIPPSLTRCVLHSRRWSQSSLSKNPLTSASTIPFRCSLPSPDTWYHASCFVSLSLKGSCERRAFPCHGGSLSLDWSALLSLILYPRGPLAFPRSPVTPMPACPALRPRWVLHTRLVASRTAAFRPLHAVGFPSLTP